MERQSQPLVVSRWGAYKTDLTPTLYPDLESGTLRRSGRDEFGRSRGVGLWEDVPGVKMRGLFLSKVVILFCPGL